MSTDVNPTSPQSGDSEENEKRSDLRVPLRVLRVEAKDSRKQEIFFGYASNISISGMFIQTASPKDKGTQVQVTFTLPNKVRVACLTEVAWVRPFSGKNSSPGMGLRFVEIDAASKEAIEKFIDSTLA
jgi:uncharacterized protein (TIGR02266 family)